MKIYTKKDFHNPENLSREIIGEKYRLFLKGEWYPLASADLTCRVPLETPLPDGTVLTSNECCWAEDVAQPVPDADGWIPHVPGDPMPCDGRTVIDVRFKDGLILEDEIASFWTEVAGGVNNWTGCGTQDGAQITAWRPHVVTKNLPRCYIAGGMTGYPDWNFPAFFAAADYLRDQGYEPVNPAELDCAAGYTLEKLKQLTPEEFREFLKGAAKRDLDALQGCDAIYLLTGWEKSKGAKAEKAVAEWLGLDVMEQNDVDVKPQPDQDGWIPHKPGDPMPCDGDLDVNYKMRVRKAKYHAKAKWLDWSGGNGLDEAEIIAWRPHKPASPTPPLHPNDPKGAAGAKKAPMHLLPPKPLMQTAWVMGHGDVKYGAWNFLDAKVLASTYIGAIGRHWAQFSSGEDTDADSGLPHLAHIAANCMIVMAAADAGTLVDDRRKVNATLSHEEDGKEQL
jgi:hypothetical protein